MVLFEYIFFVGVSSGQPSSAIVKLHRIGIDIEQYRATIGNRFKRIRSFKGKCKNDQLLAEPILTYETVFFLVATLFFVYFFPLYTSVHILAINSPLIKGVSFLSHGNEGHENCSISLSPIILFITVVISTKKCANFLSIYSRVFYSYLTLSISLLVISKYPLVFAKFPRTSDSRSKLMISCRIK